MFDAQQQQQHIVCMLCVKLPGISYQLTGGTSEDSPRVCRRRYYVNTQVPNLLRCFMFHSPPQILVAVSSTPLQVSTWSSHESKLLLTGVVTFGVLLVCCWCIICHQLIGTCNRNTQLRRRVASLSSAARPEYMYVRTRSW